MLRRHTDPNQICVHLCSKRRSNRPPASKTCICRQTAAVYLKANSNLSHWAFPNHIQCFGDRSLFLTLLSTLSMIISVSYFFSFRNNKKEHTSRLRAIEGTCKPGRTQQGNVCPNLHRNTLPVLPLFPFSNFASFSMATAEKFSNQIVKHVVFCAGIILSNQSFKFQL